MLEKLKNKYIHKFSSIVGDSPIILLFSIYITLFTFIQNISPFKTIITFCLLVCFLKLSSYQKFVKAILIVIVLLSISITFLPGKISEGAHVVVGEVVSIERNSYDLKITKSNNESLTKPSVVRIYDEINESSIGSKSIASLNIKPLRDSSNPGQFSSKNYLESIGISSIAYDCTFIESVAQSKIKYLTIKIRKYLQGRLSKMPRNLHSISIAMLFGDKTALDLDIKDNYATAGLAHLLVVSGLHLTILVTLIKVFLSKLSIKIKNQTVILLLFIWAYAYISGLSYSILRASIMISTLLIVNAYNKEISKLENIAFAAILILTIHPYALKNIGWQLSFLATFGLLILSSKVEEKLLIECRLKKPISAILSVQIMTIPLIINTFNTLSLLTIPANLIMVPFTSVLLIIGLVSVLPIFNSILIPIFTLLVNLHLNITTWIAKFSNFIIFIKSWPILLVIIYYLLIFIYFFTSLKNLKKLILIVFLVVLLVVNIEFYPEVAFLDVGQGDCAYISTGTFNGNKKILIDGGNLSNYSDSGKDVIIPFLKTKGIKEVDMLIISHPHKDHIGGILSLIDNIKIEELYLSYLAYKSDKTLLVEVIDKCKDRGIKIRLLKDSDKLIISKNAKIDILHPTLLDENFDENNSSLVLNISLEKIKILFTGDIEKNAEDYLIKNSKELKADILKIPHHGSITSSSKSFIKSVNPSIAINSSGRNHFLNHPDKEVIMRYNDRRVNVFRTDTDGAIIIKIANPLNIYSYLRKKEEKIWLQQQWKS